MKRRTITAVRGITIVLLLIISFLQVASIIRAEFQSGQQATVIRFMGWGAGATEVENYQRMIDDFETANPDIIVNYEIVTNNYHENILTSFAAGIAPDIFYLDSVWAPRFMEAGALYAINDLTTQTVIDQYYSSLLKPFTGTDGKVYGFPKDWSMLQLYYNKSALSKAGWSSTPDTWDELKECAINITDATGKPGLVYTMEFNRWVPLLTSNGAPEPWFESVADATWFDNQAVKDSLNYSIELYLEGRKAKEDAGEVPWIAEASDVGAGWRGDAFGSGECGMVISGNWMIPFMNGTYPNFKYDTDWGIAPMPKGSAGRSTMAYTVALGINKDSYHPQEAWKFVEFLLGTDGQTELVVKMGQTLPSIKGLETHTDLWPEHAETLSHVYNTTTVFAWGAKSAAIERDFSTTLGSAMRAEITADEAITAMKDIVIQDMDQPPSIGLNFPVNKATVQSGTLIDLNVTDDLGLSQVLYNWDSNGDVALNAPYDVFIPTGEGSHILRVYAIDTVGKWSEMIFIFTTDDTAPIINLMNPENNSIHHPGTLVHLSVSDNIDLNQVLINWDGRENETLSEPFDVFIPIDPGVHILQVDAQDLAGNWATAVFVFMTEVDSTSTTQTTATSTTQTTTTSTTQTTATSTTQTTSTSTTITSPEPGDVTSSWNVLLLLLSLITIFSLRRYKKKS